MEKVVVQMKNSLKEDMAICEITMSYLVSETEAYTKAYYIGL